MSNNAEQKESTVRLTAQISEYLYFEDSLNPKSKYRKKDLMRPALNIKCALFAATMAASAVVTGCASALRIDASVSEIRAAGELGIAEVPQAKVHMRLAREQMKLAEKMVANEEWDQAESMLKRAQADAALALLLFQRPRN